MGQYIYCGRRTTLSIGDVLLRRRILEDAIVCNVERHDRRLWCPSTKAPGDYAIVISHNTDNGTPNEGCPPPEKGRNEPRQGQQRLTPSGAPPPSAAAATSPRRRWPAPSHLRWMTSSSISRSGFTNRSVSLFSPWHYPLSLRNRCDARTHSVERKEKR